VVGKHVSAVASLLLLLLLVPGIDPAACAGCSSGWDAGRGGGGRVCEPCC